MFSENQLTSSVPVVVDVSGRGISDVTQIPGGGREVAALTADNNRLVSLNGIHTFASLVQLSLCSNNLVDISAVSSLTRLVTLNLQNNSITVIEGLDSLTQLEWLGLAGNSIKLTQLEWLGLAGNSIKVMSGLAGNTKLAHVDLSDNCITELGNISMLQNLKTLLLHGNAVKLLKSIPKCFPPSLSTLSLAENHVQDLNEISFLSTLPELKEVSVMGNPCVSLTHHSTLFDYRPYVVYWCPGLSSLDGTPITAEEKLRSVSLFRSDHAYPFQLGQHQLLVQYLMTACPLPILQNQLVSESEKSSVSRESSTHSLLSQAMSLQNPQQKADVMQKLRVLQVIEQMISEQETLLSSQQQEQQQTLSCQEPLPPPPDTTSSAFSGRYMEDENQSCQQEKRGVGSSGGEPDSSQADTTLTTVEEEDIIQPEPSQQFDILDGSTWSMGSSLPAVRMAWLDRETGGTQSTAAVLPGGVADGTVGGREEGKEREREKEEGGVESDEPDFDMPVSTTQHLLISNANSVTPLPGSTAGETGTKSEGMENENTTQERTDIQTGMDNDNLPVETEPRALGGQNDKFHTKTPSNASLDSDSTSGNVAIPHTTVGNGLPAPSVAAATPATVPVVTSWERMRREFSDIPLQSSSSAALSTQSLPTPEESDTGTTVGGTLPTAAPSLVESNIDGAILTATQDLAESSSDATIVNAPTSTQTLTESSSDATVIVPSLEKTAEGGPLEVKYSSPVDPPTFFPVHGGWPPELVGMEGGLESGTQFQSGLGGGSRTSSVPEWDLSSQASSLSYQPYGNADLGESVTVHAGGQQHPPRVDNTNERGREVGGKGHGGMEEQELEATCRDNIASYPSKFAQKGGISKQLEGRSGGSERKEDGGVEEGKRGGDHEARGQARTSFRKLVGQQTPDVISTEAGEGMTDIGVSRGEGEERQRAVVKIQAWLRGVLCRRGVRQYRIRRHAAITIQATWRGYRSRRCDPAVVDVMRELSHKKMEAYVATMYLQLKGCREELAHQAQVIQLQDETISSLIQEVERLSAWKVKVEEAGAVDTIQRRCGHVKEDLFQESGVLRICASHQMCIPLYVHTDVTYRREHKTKNKQRDGESLLVVCNELRQQVRDLEMKFESLAVDCNTKCKTGTGSAMSLPAPGKLSMSRHSSDTIQLQWTASDAGSSTLLGYKVYVNGIEEGMVGPTKDRAYIEGLDTSSTYRFSVRAVYNRGESEDSNILLVAAVGDAARKETPSAASQKEILSLPRPTEPPKPTELPALVEKTSALSKSASFSTLETVSLEVSAVNKAHSMSLNLPSSLTGAGSDQLSSSTDQVGTSVDPPDPTNVPHQTSTNVDVVPCLADSTSASAHETTASTSTVDPDFSKGTLPPVLGEDPSSHTHPIASRLPDNLKTPSRQEVVHELSGRHSHTEPSNTATHTEHDKNDVSAPNALPRETTTKAESHRLKHSKQGRQTSREPHSPEKPYANEGLSYGGKEMASLVRVEAKEVPTVDQLCGQTQTALTSVNNEGVLQTDTPPLAIEKHSPSLNTVGGGGRVTYSDQLTSTTTATSPENRRKKMLSPVYPRSHRLAANFDGNLSGSHRRNTGMPSTSQPPKTQTLRCHRELHATELSDYCPPALQSNPSPSVSPTLDPQPNKCRPSVGQTPIPAPSERHSEQITFSGEERGGTDRRPLLTSCQQEDWEASCQEEHQGMTRDGIFGSNPQQPVGKTGEVAHLSAGTCQPTTQHSPDKHPMHGKCQPWKAATGCLVGPPPSLSDLVAPTSWVDPKSTPAESNRT